MVPRKDSGFISKQKISCGFGIITSYMKRAMNIIKESF